MLGRCLITLKSAMQEGEREEEMEKERVRERENPVVDCGNLAKLILERARSSITVNSQRQVQESTLDFGQKRGAGRDREQT